MSRRNEPHGTPSDGLGFTKKVKKLKRNPAAFLRDAQFPWFGRVLQPGSVSRRRLEARLASLGVDHRHWLPPELPRSIASGLDTPSRERLTVQQAHALVFLDSFPSEASLQGRRFLDVGCGDGFVAVIAKRRNAREVWAVDKAAPERDHLGRPLMVAQHQIAFARRVTDIADGNFDVVWCHHVLEHIEAPVDFLRTLRAKLCPTGWLWITVPNMANNAVFSPGHLHNYFAPSLAAQLQLASFGSASLKVWAHKGQLRMRVPRDGVPGYPPPMEKALQTSGRCPSEALERWRWEEPDHR